MTTSTRIHSIDDARQANRAAGGHWFDRDAMRGFGTRILAHTSVLDGRALLFVSSEYTGFDRTSRAYSVRIATATGRMVDDPRPPYRFLAHDTSRAARRAMYDLADQMNALPTTLPDTDPDCPFYLNGFGWIERSDFDAYPSSYWLDGRTHLGHTWDEVRSALPVPTTTLERI